MTTWFIDVIRDGHGNLITTAPEDPPDWVDSLVGDITFRMHESPDARHITVKVTGPGGAPTTPEEQADAGPDWTAPTTAGDPLLGAAADAPPTTPDQP